jgi:release factor glutamine methyltransferase
MMALDGGKDGLDFYRRIAEEAPSHLNKNGILMMEIGHDQGETVPKLLEDSENFEDIRCLKDLAGKDRIVVAKLKKK